MRLVPIERDELNDQQRTVLEAIENGPRAAGRPGIGMIGPFGAWVRAPNIGQAIQREEKRSGSTHHSPRTFRKSPSALSALTIDPALSFQRTGHSP